MKKGLIHLIITVVVIAVISFLAGCQNNIPVLTCDNHGGIKSWHGSDKLEVTCKDGTVFEVEWL